MNLLCQIAGILVIVAAAWLVWTRPSAMSWGFFLYVNWFNPGQVYAFYAILEQWPLALLVQDAASILAQAAGYAGFLLFVLRVPNNKTEPRWRRRRARVAARRPRLCARCCSAPMARCSAHPAETVTRAVDPRGLRRRRRARLAILLARRRYQTPEDYQRVRWVIWGCLIGLPSFLLAELASTTTIFETRWGDFTPTEDIIGLLYLVNGVLCLFVFEALRRQRVVSVMIPLRRVTILGLSLSVPVLLAASRDRAHPGTSALCRAGHGSPWAPLPCSRSPACTRARFISPTAISTARSTRPEQRLGQAIRAAKKPAEIDRLLADETYDALKLASAASFRREGPVFARDGNGKGWDRGKTTNDQGRRADARAAVPAGKPFRLKDEDGDGLDLPSGLSRPVLAVPAVNPVRCFAVSLYGPHASGTDLDAQ